jgi:hypothetical protein
MKPLGAGIGALVVPFVLPVVSDGVAAEDGVVKAFKLDTATTIDIIFF